MPPLFFAAMAEPSAPDLKDVLQWEVRSWSRALPLWQRYLPVQRPARALAIGEREGGLSLWLAHKGFEVTCTDLHPFPEATSGLHARYGVQDRITYAQADVLALPFPDASFEVAVFKSVIGALGTKDAQAQAVRELHRVLKPGGVLLFAENLSGSPVHRWLRRRFVAWDHYWRYLQLPADRDLFDPFFRVDLRSTGLLANLGRSECQRDLLARADGVICKVVPSAWHTVVYGVAEK